MDRRSDPNRAEETCGPETKIEELAYLSNLKPSTQLPNLDVIAETFRRHNLSVAVEKRLVLAAWTKFIKLTGIKGIDDITAEVAIGYQDKIHKLGYAGKSQSHLFNRVRTILRFVQRRAVAVDAIAKALTSLSLIRASETTTSRNPEPITVPAFSALLAAADAEDKAMILLMLNAALYLQEVVALRKPDIKDDRHLISHRKKKGKIVRIAVLWPETIKALEALPNNGDAYFYSETGLPLTISGAEKRFAKLRLKAGAVAASTTASHLRDGAATAAAEAGVSEEICKMLEGHSTGIRDAYVKRNPMMVKPATDAVYKHYFPKR